MTTVWWYLREAIHHGNMVIINKFIDSSALRPQTNDRSHYSARGVCHTQGLKHFVPKHKQEVLIETARKLELWYLSKEMIVTIEKICFKSRAERFIFCIWGAGVTIWLLFQGGKGTKLKNTSVTFLSIKLKKMKTSETIHFHTAKEWIWAQNCTT